MQLIVCKEAKKNKNKPVSRILYSPEGEPLSFIYAAYPLQFPQAEIQRAAENYNLHDITTHEVYQANTITCATGGRLPHLFTLTMPRRGGFPFCGTICHYALKQ